MNDFEKGQEVNFQKELESLQARMTKQQESVHLHEMNQKNAKNWLTFISTLNNILKLGGGYNHSSTGQSPYAQLQKNLNSKDFYGLGEDANCNLAFCENVGIPSDSQQFGLGSLVGNKNVFLSSKQLHLLHTAVQTHYPRAVSLLTNITARLSENANSIAAFSADIERAAKELHDADTNVGSLSLRYSLPLPLLRSLCCMYV